MLPVFPVYPFSLCISKSTHAGALPGPAYPYFDNHASTEIHTVLLIPGPWANRSGRVFGDANVMMLDGHDTGMMIPHLSPIMDNLLLPMTLLTSSCKWPFGSVKNKSQGKGLIGFFPAYAPYVFCDSPAAGKPSSKNVQKRSAKPPAPLPKKKSSPARKKLQAFGEKTGFEMSLNGRGRVYIPTCKTVMMRLSFAELLLGWAKFLAEKTLDALVGAALKHVPSGGRRLPRLDSDLARSRALREFSEGQARVLSRAARREVMEHIATEIVSKSAYDGVLKSMILDGKFKAPYGLFSYSPAEEKGTFLWWGQFDGVPCPIEFKGLNDKVSKALEGAIYQPQVDELLADNPNYANTPKGSAR